MKIVTSTLVSVFFLDKSSTQCWLDNEDGNFHSGEIPSCSALLAPALRQGRCLLLTLCPGAFVPIGQHHARWLLFPGGCQFTCSSLAPASSFYSVAGSPSTWVWIDPELRKTPSSRMGSEQTCPACALEGDASSVVQGCSLRNILEKIVWKKRCQCLCS